RRRRPRRPARGRDARRRVRRDRDRSGGEGAPHLDGVGHRSERAARAAQRGATQPRGRVPPADRRRGGDRVNATSLSVHQLKYEQKMYWRTPASAVFTFAFPVMFLVIFASLNTNSTIDFLGGLKYNQYYVPGIICFGIISATYTNLAMTITIRRDAGLLK